MQGRERVGLENEREVGQKECGDGKSIPDQVGNQQCFNPILQFAAIFFATEMFDAKKENIT